MQVPPAFSAISVNGVRSYKRARAGDAVELPPRSVEVLSATLVAVSDVAGSPVWTVAYTVSKGTYIRALARDLGRSVDSAAHVASLRRTASGTVTLSDCLDIDALTVDAAQSRCLDPVRVLGCPAILVPTETLEDIRCGRRLSPKLVSAATRPVGGGRHCRARARGIAACRRASRGGPHRHVRRVPAGDRRRCLMMPLREELERDFLIATSGAPVVRLDGNAPSTSAMRSSLSARSTASTSVIARSSSGPLPMRAAGASPLLP